MRAIGLMSGTSLDGVDVALIETDGVEITAFGPTGLHLYADHEAGLLRKAIEDARHLTDRGARPGVLAEAELMVTTLHQAAVRTFLKAEGIDPASIDVVGFHGQTVLHRPEQLLTVQIGHGPMLARALGIPVIHDFRAADVTAGGQGAPLVPIYHRALARGLDRPHPVAVLNIGGVANVTYLDGERDPVACDTGPGNALIDDFMAERTGEAKDTDGAMAAAGRVNKMLLAQLMEHPFFSKPAPKSLDRNDFRARLHMQSVLGMSAEDAAATLTAFTAASVAAIVPMLPRPPRTWIVAGGGSHNRTLMRMLAERLAPARVESARAVGWSTDALEAQAFAYLAVRSLKGLPITFPTTTGISQPMTGGVLVKP